jgi:hypothetical protein
MEQNFYGYVDNRLNTFGQHIHDTMYNPIMTRLEQVHTGLHIDIEALDARFGDMNVSGSHSGPHGGSSSSYSDTEARSSALKKTFTTSTQVSRVSRIISILYSRLRLLRHRSILFIHIFLHRLHHKTIDLAKLVKASLFGT